MLDKYDDRTATAEVCFGLCDGEEVHLFKGSRKGIVVDGPRGKVGFGFDPIFIPDGYKKTWAAMDVAEARESSIRRLALEKLSAFLAEKK